MTHAEMLQLILGAMFIADEEPCPDRSGHMSCNHCKAAYVIEALERVGAVTK